MNYTLNTLPEIIAQVVHFSRDDYQNGEYPDDCAWNAGYIVACLLAQHTTEGGSGVDTEQGYVGMKVTEDMPYDARVQLAKQLVDYWGGVKPQPASALAEALRRCAAESTPAEYAETVDGAVNLTAYDWVARAIGTLRAQDDGEDTLIGDVLDDLVRAEQRLLAARATLAESAAQGATLLHEARMTLSMLEAMTSGDPEKPYRPSRDAMAYVRTRTAKLRAALERQHSQPTDKGNAP